MVINLICCSTPHIFLTIIRNVHGGPIMISWEGSSTWWGLILVLLVLSLWCYYCSSRSNMNYEREREREREFINNLPAFVQMGEWTSKRRKQKIIAYHFYIWNVDLFGKKVYLFMTWNKSIYKRSLSVDIFSFCLWCIYVGVCELVCSPT